MVPTYPLQFTLARSIERSTRRQARDGTNGKESSMDSAGDRDVSLGREQKRANVGVVSSSNGALGYGTTQKRCFLGDNWSVWTAGHGDFTSASGQHCPRLVKFRNTPCVFTTFTTTVHYTPCRSPRSPRQLITHLVFHHVHHDSSLHTLFHHTHHDSSLHNWCFTMFTTTVLYTPSVSPCSP